MREMPNVTKREGKNGTSYLICISAGYDANGRQVKKSMSWRPDPGMSEKKIEKELIKIAADFDRKVKNGDVIDLSNIKLSDFCAEYLKLNKNVLAPTTCGYYKTTIENLVNPQLGHLKVKDIKPIHVQRFISFLGTPEARTDGKGGTLSASSIQRYFVVLKSMMAQAYKLGLTDSNPTDTDRLTLPPIEETEVEVFTEQEAAHMLSCLESEPLMWRAFINLALVTGCRRGELVGLKWADINFKNNSIEVARSNYKLKGEPTQSKSPKTKKSVRTIAIDGHTSSLLSAWHMAQMIQRMEIADQWHDEEWTFTQWNGDPMNPTTPTSWFREFQERHGIPHHKFHALRHTSGTLFLAAGINIKTVASRLGHTQLSTVNRYVHSLTDSDKAAAQTFDNLHKEPVQLPKKA